MRGILADINVGAQGRVLLRILTSETWREVWIDLRLVLEDFPTLGLAYNASDAEVWRTCQREGLVLITGNRNKKGLDSLEAVIESENQPDSLPVITIANTERLLQDRSYAEKVAERLLERLIAIDDLRGTGRLYVP